MARRKVLRQVHAERDRQELLKALGKFAHTCADHEWDNMRKFSVLAEEFGEVAREVYEEFNAKDRSQGAEVMRRRIMLRTELIQVAAVCVAWAESLPERMGDG